MQDTVKRVYDNVPYYRSKMDELGIKPEDIKQLSDVQKLPFTVKDDLRAHYPFGLLAVPMKQVNRIHASSGDYGKLYGGSVHQGRFGKLERMHRQAGNDGGRAATRTLHRSLLAMACSQVGLGCITGWKK